MPLSLVQNEMQSEIRLEGQANIGIASELKELLLDQLSARRPLHVNLSDATEIDVCIFQLLLAADRAWKEERVRFTLHGPLQAQASFRLTQAGLPALSLEAEEVVNKV